MNENTILMNKIKELRMKLNNIKFQHPVYPDFTEFAYSKVRHLEKFENTEFNPRKINPRMGDMKVYEDLLIYNFIKNHLKEGAKILEIGGGYSRIIEFLKYKYEFWNLDKLEGLGSGPTDLKVSGFRLVRDYIGSFNKKLPENYFDLVFSISTLEHVPHDPENFKNIIKDIDRILKKDGYSVQCIDCFLSQDKIINPNNMIEFLMNNKKMLFKYENYPELLNEIMENSNEIYFMDPFMPDNRFFLESVKKKSQIPQFYFSINLFWMK